MNQLIEKLFHYLYRKKLFGFLITAFLLTAVISWFYLTSAIQSNINYRLERELNHVTTSVHANIYNYANTLSYVHAYFKTEGLPNGITFRRLAESIEVQQVNHGIQGLGYISIVKKRDLPRFLRQNKNRPFFNIETLQPGREIYAPITMVEPLTWLRSKRLGTDMLIEDSRREAILGAVRSSGLTLSKPLKHLGVDPNDQQAAVLLLLPFYSTLETPATPDERIEKVRGLIYIPIRMRHFFEAALGKPSLQGERVNFTLSYVDPATQTDVLLYERFPHEANSGALKKDRIIDIYGHKWRVQITTFPQFFNFGDRYLANTVALAFLLFIGLLYSLLKQTESILNHNKQAKDLMETTILQGREQTAKLKLLNDINSQSDLDIDMSLLIQDLFNAALPVSGSTHSFLFCSLAVDRPDTISFYQAKGFLQNEVNRKDFNLQKLTELLPKNLVRKNDRNSSAVFSIFTNGPDLFTDWLTITIPSREFRRFGVLFLGRTGTEYSDIEIEMIESMVSQFGVRIDNLRLFKKVEDANKVKTAFLSNMSHEIRTPLNAITGFSEILEQSTSSEEKHNLIEGIKKNSSQLTSIIDNILDISKIEFGQIYINRNWIALTELMKSIQNSMEPRARAKGLNLVIESNGRLPQRIETDESRVKQILINLIGNAIKFTEKGSITLSISCEAKAESSLVFRIKDTGIGIPPESQMNLFQSFSQVDGSSTRRFGGIGLGLALSRRLARQFGGDVALIESSLRSGSTFQLKIPVGDLRNTDWIDTLGANSSLAEDSSSLKEEVQALRNKNVLIVEDSVDNQEIFKFFLKSAGARTEVIDNGEDAVKKVGLFNYDFILMDIQLPKMDGLEATRRIRSAGYERPIIALTAHASADEKASCLDAGCIDLITKPVTQVTLIRRIQTILKEFKYVGH